MVGAVIVILVLGVSLPLVAFLTVRWRTATPERLEGHDDTDTWLISEFKLGSLDRSLVRKAVLTRRGAESTPLKPDLRAAARGLGARVLSDQVGKLRTARRVGWIQLVMTVVYAGIGVFILARGAERWQTAGVILLLYAGVSAVSAAYNGVIAPRLMRRNAERLLGTAATAGAPAGARGTDEDQA
jgi:hypothetical protein